ncbi:MAG: hypothetical protein H0V91_13100 [Flavisolibacter sp.]|nr:hypothetical protein [Flavisolibacter sp.]
MSTYFFKTNMNSEGLVSQAKTQLDQLQQSNEIDRWNVDFNHPEHILEIETQSLSPDMVKHKLREMGIEADFTKAPEAR